VLDSEKCIGCRIGAKLLDSDGTFFLLPRKTWYLYGLVRPAISLRAEVKIMIIVIRLIVGISVLWSHKPCGIMQVVGINAADRGSRKCG
jgi:hypothetical protein